MTEKIADFDDEKGVIQEINKNELPMYCGYYHISFYGQAFSPELTYSKKGFIMRRKPGTLSFGLD